MAEYKRIGVSVDRKDALEKVTGAAIYSADVHPKGMLYGKILSSPIAHGKIISIDTSKAEALPGVVAVVTGKDAPEIRQGPYVYDRHILCKEHVRYVGDRVAAVAATTEQIAEEAIRLIDVQYEELPHVLDVEEAYKADCPVVIHEGWKDYTRPVYHHFDSTKTMDESHPNVFLTRQVRHGDVEKGFAESDLIVENRYVLPLASHGFLEPHATVCAPNPDGSIDIWASEQEGKLSLDTICEVLGLTKSKIHLHIPYLGGGFGGKTTTANTLICCLLAMKAKRPVNMPQSREEVFETGSPRASAVIYLKEGYKNDGMVVSRKFTCYINAGAYSTQAYIFCNSFVHGAGGSYKNPNFSMDNYGVYTNTPPAGPYRALGSELLVFAIERNIEKAADILGMDKLEIRLKNLLVDGDEDGFGQLVGKHYTNDTVPALKKAAEHIKWGEPKHAPEGPWVYGKGLSTGNKFVAFGPTGTEAWCIVREDGVVEIRTFHNEMGQGAMTVDVIAAAEEFDMPAEKILISNKDADNCPYDEGTYCSRGTFLNMHAVKLACEDAKRQMFERASKVMGIPADRLETHDGRIYETGNMDNSIPFSALFEFGGWHPDGVLMGKAVFCYPNRPNDEYEQGDYIANYSYGAWGIEVKVNTETGELVLIDCAGYYDCGRVMNPIVCEAQVEGSFSMGLGQAVYEEVLMNDAGKVINGNFRDYKIPTFMDGPRNDQLHVGFVGRPHFEGPYGAKGIGEVAMIPVMPGVVNALYDAIGAELDELPATRERVLNAIRKARHDGVKA